MNRRGFLTLAAVAGLSPGLPVLLCGCSRKPVSGPPTLRPGRDECAECGMLIGEDRSACALVIEIGRVREHVMFDDIGCLLDYEHQTPQGITLVEGYVRDYARRAWVPASTAQYLLADHRKLKTPMGSGIAAFGTIADAESAQREYGGEIMAYPRLVVARREWMEARYSKPKEPS